MTESSYPFPPAVAGDLGDPGVIATADKWRRLTRFWATPGVHFDQADGTDGSLRVYPASDALAVDLTPGTATVAGFHYENTARLRFLVNTADATRDRWDRIVARLVLDPATGSGRVRAFYVPGIAGSPIARSLVQTPTTYEIDLGRFLVRAGQGRAGDSVTSDFAHSSRGDSGLRVWDSLPDRQDAGYPWRAGERCIVQGGDTGGSPWEYVWDGFDWCIAPGQLLYFAAFQDSQAQNYQQGFYRIGQRGGADSNFFFKVPRVLYRHGLRTRFHVWPGTVGVGRGDVLTVSLYNYAAGSGAIGIAERSVVNGDAPSPFFNDTINGETTFWNNDTQLGQPDSTVNVCVAGLCGSGLVHFLEGRFTVESI